VRLYPQVAAMEISESGTAPTGLRVAPVLIPMAFLQRSTQNLGVSLFGVRVGWSSTITESVLDHSCRATKRNLVLIILFSGCTLNKVRALHLLPQQ